MRLKSAFAASEPLSGWPRPQLPPFIAAPELGIIKDQLRRYLRGEVPGRSFLIAGHRGVGKTSLVRRAVDELADALLLESTRGGAADAGILPAGPFQRPILVKLHGPTMLKELTLGTPEAGGAGAPGKPAGAGTTEVTAGPHSALVSITIALYRALVAEIGAGYAASASQGMDNSYRPRRREMATQLMLDLDRGADPAMLRQAWTALGRLDRGVLWPQAADDTLWLHGMQGQGLRELAMLTTAGHAFLKCTGKLSQAQKRENQRAQESEAGAKASADGNRLTSLVTTLGIAGAAGAAVQAGTQNTAGAVGAGLLAWLAGTLSLDWSAKRSSKANLSFSENFDIDVSLPTLERDLPQIINRMRQAGLAPVFAIDELDKVADPDRSIDQLIRQLKHIVTDIGFFCFLVDRDYFERLEQRLRQDPYGIDHTFFSDRLLLRPDPASILTFLTGNLDPGGEGGPEAGTKPAAIGIAALGLMYESRLNLTTLMRSLARLNPAEDADSIANSQRRRVLASMQIAINLALARTEIDARAQSDPGFGQHAVDTAYYVAFTLDSGTFEVNASEEALRLYLNARIAERQGLPAAGAPAPGGQAGAAAEAAGTPAAGTAAAGTAAAGTAAAGTAAAGAAAAGTAAAGTAAAGTAAAGTPCVGDAELKLLYALLRQMLSHVENFGAFRAALTDQKLHRDLPVWLVHLLPSGVEGLCEREGDSFHFKFDQFGNEVSDSIYLDSGDVEAMQRGIGYLDALDTNLRELGLSLEDLSMGTPLLKSINPATRAGAVSVVQAAATSLLRSGEYDDARALIQRAKQEIERNAGRIGWLAVIVSNLLLDLDARRGLSTPELLAGIGRLLAYDRKPRQWLADLAAPPGISLPADAGGLEAWAAMARGLTVGGGVTASGASGTPQAAPALLLDWPGLRGQLLDFFGPRSRAFFDVGYRDLVAAVRLQTPQRCLYVQPAAMTIGDWSALACSCIPPDPGGAGGEGPYWGLIACLRALGFGRAALSRAVLQAGGVDQVAAEGGWVFAPDGPKLATPLPRYDASVLGSDFLVGADERPAGLPVLQDLPGVAASLPNAARAIWLVPPDFWQTHGKALNFLMSLGVFDA